MDPAAKLTLAAILSIPAGLLVVACLAKPEDRAEATRAAIRNAPVACAIYLTDERIPKEPALDEICRAVAGVGESDAVRSEEIPPSGTGSAVPTTPELPDGGATDAPDGSPGNGVRHVE